MLGERLVRNEEASGSIPLRSTIPFNHLQERVAAETAENRAPIATLTLRDLLRAQSPGRLTLSAYKSLLSTRCAGAFIWFCAIAVIYAVVFLHFR